MDADRLVIFLSVLMLGNAKNPLDKVTPNLQFLLDHHYVSLDEQRTPRVMPKGKKLFEAILNKAKDFHEVYDG